jgi:alkylation response protein AidB-like acyl-CoA dehydrogenase/flavin-dependent dehydrogenase/ferredoxin-like protein FixX
MAFADFDVVIVGAGAAGLTAAIGLARRNFRVAVVEAAAFPGAENWSGCVYFAENLAEPEILGPEGVEALAWERRLVERGLFATDGHGLLGMKYRDSAAFRHCYTVLRPIYDHHLAQVALQLGVALLCGTTAESLLRERGRVVGIATQRGAIHARLTFLAEGDASHLVAREGYERSLGGQRQPKFLHGIKQIIELPPRAIEQRFGVEPDQGVAYEMLLRNGTLRGKSVHLNMGGFLYTNRQSLSIGLVLPADHLHENFDGDPNLLMQWFLTLPALRPWFDDHMPGPFGAKLIRGGGALDIPTLIDDGLAIGGAASAIGVDFPYPNFTGPATAMGLLLARAAAAIRDQGGSFTRDELDLHYLERLKKTHYWRDVEFLRHWPGYVKETRVFFDKNIDVALGSAHLWTRPGAGLTARLASWRRLLDELLPPDQHLSLASDLRHLGEALRVQAVARPPSIWKLLLDATLNSFRDLLRSPRPLPSHGEMTIHYSIAGGAAPAGLPPALVRQWGQRILPALASAAAIVYANNTTPLAKKLPAAVRVLTGCLSLGDVMRLAGLGMFTGVQAALGRLRGPGLAALADAIASYFRSAQQATDMTAATATASARWDERLAMLAYETEKASHIHVLWPQSLSDKNAVTKAGLWHVCPAHVYEARVSATGQLQVVVNFENCIKCETCWRTSDLADWARDGGHRFVYAVHSPSIGALLPAMDAAGRARPQAPYSPPCPDEPPANGKALDERLAKLSCQLDAKLRAFDAALAEEPRTIDGDRAEYLEFLALYAERLAQEIATSGHPAFVNANGECQILAGTQERLRLVQARKYAWAAAEGRRLRFQHLDGAAPFDRVGSGLSVAEGSSASLPGSGTADALARRLDAVLPAAVWREVEHKTLDSIVEANLLRQIGPVTSAERPAMLAELGRRDPSLAWRAAHHLWARDLAAAHGGPQLAAAAQRWSAGAEWACFAAVSPNAETLFVPAAGTSAILMLQGDKLVQVPRESASIRPLATLGLRGAGLAWVGWDDFMPLAAEGTVDPVRTAAMADALASADLIAIAYGMADYLCKRAMDHAGSRVQFPGLFHDESARDTIAKFGAVKKMLAEMAAGRLVLEAMTRHTAPKPAVGVLFKAVAAEVLGTAPGSVAYNAGQVFGGTGYSEDDTLSKYYRDASAWRFLGAANPVIYARHGAALLSAWTPEGDALTRLDGEDAAFEELLQRQALAPHLQHHRQLCALVVKQVNAWKFSDETLPVPAAQEAFADALARLDALLLAGKLVLMHVHRLFEQDRAGELEVALLRVWLRKIAADVDDFQILEQTLTATDLPVPPAGQAPVTQYADFLKSPQPYSSGDFLITAADPGRPRYVPEMIETDAGLRDRNQELIASITSQFGAPREGKVYERYLEGRHRPDQADLDFLFRQGYFRMPIAKDFGGEGRSKADYYLLVVNSHRLADAAISLTIQVNSSLGSTPVLVAREKELPKAKKGASGERADELARREEAADLFCRWVASGQISAFALTEPSAGSDTARVATRARLRQVSVEAGECGTFRFVPAAGKTPRTLIDARRLVFLPGAHGLVPHYRYADGAEPAPLRFDAYDYETDGCKLRTFDCAGRRIAFDDIGQLRERDGKLWYDYFELNGAKMWITNGRCMGIMALYAKTDEGVTGFIVDRHAEGLIVGKDEAKMGQNGSPTNELSLQAVRVPRENLIGLEGRGQVNALETLNVGRAGLAMSAMSQMIRLCTWSQEFAAGQGESAFAWSACRLDRLEEERFIAESLAYEIIGRFEHKGTKSVRMESAIAKMLASELFHHSIELAEEVHGLAGQTEEHLVEKRKRDARVLNIYEGTNEIQRFLILRELTDLQTSRAAAGRSVASEATKARLLELIGEAVQVFGQQLWQNPNLQANCFLLAEAAAWLAATESTHGRLTWLYRQGGYPADLLAAGKRSLVRCRGEAEKRLERFAEELKRLRSGHYPPEIRAATLLLQPSAAPAASESCAALQRSFAILVVVDEPLPQVPRPRVRAGRIVDAYRVLTSADRSALEAALRIKEASPEKVRIEIVAVASAAAALLLREALSLGADRVRLVTSSLPSAPDRAAAALGHLLQAEQFDLILGGAGAADSQEGLVARMTAAVLGVDYVGTAARVAVGGELELIDSAGQRRLRPLPAAVAIESGVPLRSFTTTGWLQGLAKAVELSAWPSEVPAAALEWEEVGSQAAGASAEEQPRPLLPRQASHLLLETAGIHGAIGPDRAGGRAGDSLPEPADVASPSFARGNGQPPIVAILAAEADGALRPTARKTLEAAQFLTPFVGGASKAVLLLAPAAEEAQHRALAELAALTPFDICLLPADVIGLSDEVRCRLLMECWSSLENFPAAVVAEPWAEDALASQAAAAGAVDPVALRVRLLDRHQGRLVAECSAARGKLRSRQALAPVAGQTLWLCLAADAEVGAVAPPETPADRTIERWRPALERFFGKSDMRRLLDELKQETGLARLSDADFIVDVGFGVGNRDGYEAVIEPLERELRRLGVKNLMVGGSRKVTEELHLLPADRQIGQSGVSVKPRVMLSIGISGAPQHLNYIAPRSTIIAFNRDPEAPIMTLNQRQARPKVYPVIGDLFETVPALTACLGEEAGELVTASK